MKNKGQIIYLGLMSGTSLDGLDAVFCSFQSKEGGYNYIIHYGVTLKYDHEIRNMLLHAPFASGYELTLYDRKYGHYIGKKINELIHRTGIVPHMVASHGHTVFHVPEEGVTLQIGHGAAIFAECNLPVMFDFRSLDVALGGQGAPLVPIGDKMLFSEYKACLNLGGFANVSMDKNGERIAWDICPVNFIANQIASLREMDYDHDGNLGRQGIVQRDLLEKMEALEYYSFSHPKSLGREWTERFFLPLLNEYNYSPEDTLRTFYEHVSNRIAADMTFTEGNVLCTGGGTNNSFLIKLIQDKAPWKLVVPGKEIIDFKEALVFAFLCFLKQFGRPNCLASVTGASRDNLSGSII